MGENRQMPGPLDHRNGVVLIIEDDRMNMILLRDVLNAHGIATIETADGERGLEIARIHQPALVIMDIELERLSGIALTQRMKMDSSMRAIPVIATSAHAPEFFEKASLEAGCAEFISKPINVHDFVRLVSTYLGIGGEEAAPPQSASSIN